MSEKQPYEPSLGPHYTHTEPSRKMDAHGLAEGVCTCGYRTSPAPFAEAAKRVQLHYEAKHSHRSVGRKAVGLSRQGGRAMTGPGQPLRTAQEEADFRNDDGRGVPGADGKRRFVTAAEIEAERSVARRSASPDKEG